MFIYKFVTYIALTDDVTVDWYNFLGSYDLDYMSKVRQKKKWRGIVLTVHIFNGIVANFSRLHAVW